MFPKNSLDTRLNATGLANRIYYYWLFLFALVLVNIDGNVSWIIQLIFLHIICFLLCFKHWKYSFSLQFTESYSLSLSLDELKERTLMFNKTNCNVFIFLLYKFLHVFFIFSCKRFHTHTIYLLYRSINI